MLAADGGRSAVRKALKLPFDGETMDENFFALHATFGGFGGMGYRPRDAPGGGGQHVTEVGLSQGGGARGGFFFTMPMPDDAPRAHLLIVDLDDAQSAPFHAGTVDAHGRAVLRAPTPNEIVEITRARGFGAGAAAAVVPGSVRWCTAFKTNSPLVAHYRSGRVFLAGDACHCHSPLGGQGMNMGMQARHGNEHMSCNELKGVQARLQTNMPYHEHGHAGATCKRTYAMQ